MIGRCVWVDYTVDDDLGVLIRLSVRMADGSKENVYVEGTEPYIFAPEDEDVPDEDYIVRTESGYESLFDHDLQKIVTHTPRQAGGLTDEFSWSGEGDVPYYRRVSIHDGLSGYIELPDERDNYGSFDLIHINDIETDVDNETLIHPRISIADIEVRVPEDQSFDEMTEKANQPINVITCYDTYEEKYSVFYYDKYDNLDTNHIREKMENQIGGTQIESYLDVPIEIYSGPTETDMLNEFIGYVNGCDFDLISGWNFTDFDYNYIINRMKTLNSEGEKIHHSHLSPFGAASDSRNDMRKIKGLPSFDMMKAFCDKLTFSNWRSKSLEYVSNEELGIGKIDDVNINQDWENEPSKLIAYNIVDVLLTVALDDVNDIHGFFYEMADACSIPIFDVFYEKRLVDGYVMSRRDDNEVLPTADKSELIENAGGYVADAANGRIRNVGVSDLKSLYPSAMITWNISTETVATEPDDFDNYVKIPKVPEPKNVSGQIRGDDIDWEWLYASLDKEGLIPRTLKKLFNKRNHEKEKMYAAEEGSAEEAKWDRKQGSTKIIMNSFYGNASSQYWRLSNQYLGDAVTSTARYTLWKGRKTLDRLDYEHVYSDTDSHFMKLQSKTLEERIDELKYVSEEMDKDASEIWEDITPHKTCPECNRDTLYDEEQKGYYCPKHGDIKPLLRHPFLVDSDLHGDNRTCMHWEAEKIAEIFMQLGDKKRYASNLSWKEGTVYHEPKISISGFENRRSDSMLVTAELQKKVILMVLTGASFDEVSEYIRNTIDEIDADNPDVNKFALPGSINKDLEDYPNRQIPRASMYSNEHLGYDFGEGDNPFVYLVKQTPSDLPNTDVVAFEWDEEIPEGFVLDNEAIIERGIRKPIRGIIQEVGWEFNELREGKQQKTMEFGNGGNPFS